MGRLLGRGGDSGWALPVAGGQARRDVATPMFPTQAGRAGLAGEHIGRRLFLFPEPADSSDVRDGQPADGARVLVVDG